ncbi:hypothetical protein [Endozoicomonas sp. 2B-B]
MANTRPNALSFAVAVAISSSIMATDAMAERKLQTKSADILNKGHTEYTRSEVIVKQTLDNDQQPIPKSCTTTYPDQTQVRADYELPSEGFTDTLSGIGGASSVDLFETDEKDVAQKYTKVLKIGNEGIFRFTHNLAEKALVIEVRNGMTDQDSIAAVRNQVGDLQSLEPLTKVASPEQLARVLKGAHERAGQLGEMDNYVALATIEVDEVNVKGRTFMRLIAANDQPPDLVRLGQSLFVNDEVLFAAATSAYTQVHVMEEDLQQEALNDLLHCHQPVGYVVHVEDDAQAYPVPVGYPRLEVTETPGEVIVFRGQKQNPADVAFVEELYNMWAEEARNPLSAAKAQIKKDKVKGYQHTIRSRQMALLENLAVELHTEEDSQATLQYEEDLWTLIHYEYLEQALTSATSDGADEFELTVEQIEDAFPVLTSTWVLNRLEKRFSFKPALRNLLTNPLFIQTIQEEIVDDSYLNQLQDDTLEVIEKLTSKPISDISRQMNEMDDKQVFLLIKELSLRHLRKEINLETQKDTISERGRLRADQLKQQINKELIQLRQERAQEKKLMQKLEQEVECNPEQSIKTHGARIRARIARSAQMAKELGIDNWDDTKPNEEQLRIIAKEIGKINRWVVAIFTATGQSDDKTVKAKPAATERERGVDSVKEFSLGYLQYIQQLLRQNREVTDEQVRKRLAIVESKLGLVPKNEDELEADYQYLPQHLEKLEAYLEQERVQDIQNLEEDLKKAKSRARKIVRKEVERIPIQKKEVRESIAADSQHYNTQLAAELGIDNWDVTLPLEEQTRLISQKLYEIKHSTAATGQHQKEAAKEKLATIESMHNITPKNENDLDARYHFIQQHLQQKAKLTDRKIQNSLSYIEDKLSLVPDCDEDTEARCQAILQHLEEQEAETEQQPLRQPLRQQSTTEKLQREPKRTPKLEQKIHDARADATKVRNAQMATELDIDNWDDTQPAEEQARRISRKIRKIRQAEAKTHAATAKSDKEAVKAKPATIGDKHSLILVNEDDLGSLLFIHNQLKKNSAAVREKLATFEGQLGLVPNHQDNLEARRRAILKRLKQQGREVFQQHFQNQQEQEAQKSWLQKDWLQKLQQEAGQVPSLAQQVHDARTGATKVRNAQMAAELGIDNWDDAQPVEEQARLIRNKIVEIKQWVAATEQPDKEAVNVKPTVIIGKRDIISVNEDDPVILQSIQQHMQQKEERTDQEIQNSLSVIERRLGLVPDSKKTLEFRCRAVREHIRMQDAQTEIELAKRKNSILSLQVEIERNQIVRKEVREVLAAAREDYNTRMAAAPGIDDRDNTQPPEEQARLISQKVHEVEQPLAATSNAATSIAATSVAATGQPGEEAFKEKLAAIEKALELDHQDREDDVYNRRNAISEEIHTYIAEAGKNAEKEALEILETVEEIFKLEINQDDLKTTRLERVRRKLKSGDVSESMLNEIDAVIWKIESSLGYHIAKKIEILQKFITFHVETPDVDGQVTKQQRKMLEAVEDELNIDTSENPSAKERGRGFAAELALDLDVEFEKGASLNDQKYALSNKIQALREKVNDHYDTEELTRDANNEIARQLDIEGYKDDAPLEDQISLIEKTLQELDEEVDIVGRPKIYDRIAAIEDELDRQMAGLGESRYVPDRDLATARREVKEAESELADVHRKLNTLPDNEDDTALYRVMNGDINEKSKTLQEYEIARQEGEIESGKADIEGMEEALKADEKAAENDGCPFRYSPFQYTPGEAEALDAIRKFSRQHPLKKQALEAAIGLAQLAAARGKLSTIVPIFNLYDEFAPIRLHAMFGVTINQARRIVEVFQNLKTVFRIYPYESLLENQIHRLNTMDEIQTLTQKVINEMGRGTQEYDNAIHGIGSAGIHLVEHSAEDQKSISEYFSTDTANGKKIISLLREGLISKIELESYIKAARGVDGYQTVAEFEHFLGYKHGVHAIEFWKIVRMLPDKAVEELIQNAFTPVVVAATGPTGIKESVAGVTDYTAAVIANYVLDDIAFENGRKTAAFLTHVQDTLTPYANAVGLSESDRIKIFHDLLMQAHATAVEQQLKDYWIKPSASLAQAVTWYYSSYKPLLVAHTAWEAIGLSLSNLSFLYLLDLTNRGDYLHRMLTPFQNWMDHYGIDPDRTGQSACHNGIEQISEAGGLAMPLGKAASSVILLRTSSMLFARQYNANPHSYRSITHLVPEIVQSMNSGGIQVPLLHRVTPQKVKTLASATAGLVLGPVATVGSYAHGLVSGFTYAQTFGFALVTSLTYDFFMNDNKMLTQWLAGPLGRSLDKINRWQGVGETDDEYVKRTAVVSPQGFSESDEEYATRVKASNNMLGWTRHENYLQFRERRDRTMKMFENSWEKYFREYVPKWSFSHAESFPYFYTLGALYEWQRGDNQKLAPDATFSSEPTKTSKSLKRIKAIDIH